MSEHACSLLTVAGLCHQFAHLSSHVSVTAEWMNAKQVPAGTDIRNRYVRAGICSLVQSAEKPDDNPGIGGATPGASSGCLWRCRVPFRASVCEADLCERADTQRGSPGSIKGVYADLWVKTGLETNLS